MGSEISSDPALAAESWGEVKGSKFGTQIGNSTRARDSGQPYKLKVNKGNKQGMKITTLIISKYGVYHKSPGYMNLINKYGVYK